jgi:hypothetical protein
MALIVRPPALFEAIHALKAFRPDYVARLGDKVIVGEVKSKERVSSGADLQALASVVNSIPGWRLELIWLGDEPDALPTSDDVERVVERARTVAQVDEEAALLLAWAGVEAAVERLSSRVGLGLRRGAPVRTDSSEGGYQYVAGGPYDAYEVLSEQFPSALEEEIEEAADRLAHYSFEWVSKKDY